jgi:hypothetical protein
MSYKSKPESDIVPAGKKSAGRVHPDRRAQLAASNRVATISGIQPDFGPDVSYYSPELIQCTLPHSDPKTRDWIRKNGNFSLIVSSGIDEEAHPIGIPYGSFPRLVLAHIITRVIETRERHIELSSHFSAFLRDIGYTGNLRGRTAAGNRLRDQLLRLLRASITYQWQGSTATALGIAVRDVKVAPRFVLWFDTSKPEEGSLFGSWIELSEEFYQSILRAPVPLRTDILKALRKSPLAIDCYMWLSYRLFSLHAGDQDALTLSYGALQQQFGTGIADENYRQFRSAFRLAFKKVAAYYQPHTGDTGKPLLNYELNETGLTLYRSPLLVSRGNRSTKADELNRILESRTFDTETRKKARMLAGNWDLAYLESQYFTWIADKEAPANLKRHFLSFVRAHIKRNGNAP